MKNIAILFLSIFMESLPFLLLGSLISSMIEKLVSDETMAKLIPRNLFFGSLVGIFLGFFIPACDCAVIPVTKRLIKKKVPLNVAISFMLASPIINPVVLLSTFYAFKDTNKEFIYYRLILGIIIAFVVGIIMGLIFKDKEVIKKDIEKNCSCHHKHNNEEEEDEFLELEKYTIGNNRILSNTTEILKHTGEDLFEVAKYLMVGALIASIIQVLLPRNIIHLFGENQVLSIFILMVFAYLISLCSTSDSFIGKSLLSTFAPSGVLAYLILGPMIDIKNTIVLLGNYKSKFVFFLISLIFIFVFLFSLVVGLV